MYYGSNELTLLAVAPGLIILIYVYAKDKVEHEPLSLILKLLLFGVISCLPASILEPVIEAKNYYTPGSLEYAAFNAFAVAALCEELSKFLLLRLGSWKHEAFNYRFDGVVYGATVAIGFAVLENVMYVFTYGFQTAIVRAVMSVPLHAFCGIIMGAYYSKAKFAEVNKKSGVIFNSILAVLVPLIIHGIYDTFAMMEDVSYQSLLIGFVIIMYIIVYRLLKKLSRNDKSLGSFKSQTLNN